MFKDLFIEPNPVPVKTALGWRGVMSAEVRLPLCEMSEANQARLRKTLEEFESEQITSDTALSWTGRTAGPRILAS